MLTHKHTHTHTRSHTHTRTRTHTHTHTHTRDLMTLTFKVRCQLMEQMHKKSRYLKNTGRRLSYFGFDMTLKIIGHGGSEFMNFLGLIKTSTINMKPWKICYFI